MFARARHGDIQLAIDGMTRMVFAVAFLEAVGCEEVELIRAADSKRVDDDIALGTLIAFDGVDGDIHQSGNAQLGYLVANHSYLVAIGNDDAHRMVWVEVAGCLSLNASQQVCHLSSLLAIGFVGCWVMGDG